MWSTSLRLPFVPGIENRNILKRQNISNPLIPRNNGDTRITAIVPPTATGKNVKPESPADKWCGFVNTKGYASNIR